ncbi:MAG: transglycosylase domain-containing protein [Bowdeniella nasicola]|nr:transglycosylase domain-containing protein [Bowdeniella nasicola]
MRWLPSWKVVAGLCAFFVVVAIGLFAAAYTMVKIPAPGDFAQARTTTVYYADAKTELGKYSEFDREPIELDDLPDHVAHAVVASEDRRFYTNPGVDIRGIARAALNNLQGKPIQGASTLTQQYVERYYVGETKSLSGKAKEAIMALKIDRQQSKEEILENYLNTIYFGRGAYGIEVAAQHYFDKHASELSLSEAALLAGIIPAPSNWDPAVMPDKAQARWERVLNLMEEDGWISADERAEQEFPETIDYRPANTMAGTEGYLVDMVRKEATSRVGISEDELNTRGYTIVTTISQARQEAAEAAIAALPDDRPENNAVGLASMDPRTGALQAVYGGPDFLTHPRNAVTQDRAQAGSTFKVWALIAALEAEKSLYDTYPSASGMEIDGFEKPVKNYDRYDRGEINLIRATQDSVNTTYALLNVDVGPEKTMDAAIRAGISPETPGLEAVPANVLGPASLTPMDQLRAYGTIAAQGVKHEPYLIAEIHDVDGRVIYRAQSESERVFDRDVIADATFAMQQVVNQGTAHWAGENLGRPAAGKTGSSEDYRSAWFAGFTPQLVTVVDMYQVGPDGEEEELTPFGGVNPIAGGTYPVRIWTEYMRAALGDEEVIAFPQPTRQSATPSHAPSTPSSEEPEENRTPSAPPATRLPEPPPSQAPVPSPTQAPPRPSESPKPPVPIPPGDEPQTESAPRWVNDLTSWWFSLGIRAG